eukprot:m.27641 g.27641  ORF g.27641 m.27641 type:complete len:1329 (-) comp7915_c0_seq1:114-4100(-)
MRLPLFATLFVFVCYASAQTDEDTMCCTGSSTVTSCKSGGSCSDCASGTRCMKTERCTYSWFFWGREATCVSGCGCSKCGYGEYASTAPGSYTDRKCSACAPGKYMNIQEHGETACKDCPQGKFQNSYSATSCKTQVVCAEGEFNSGGVISPGECRKCYTGYYNNNPRHSGWCTSCPKGLYQNERGQTACKLQITCGQGEYNSGGIFKLGVCSKCPLGQYMDLTNHNETTCIPCKDGFHANEVGMTECIPKTVCGPGQYVDGGKTTTGKCVSCPPGTYMDLTSHTQHSCVLCPTGKHQDLSGRAACKDCILRTTYQNERGQEKCKTIPLCNSGQYLPYAVLTSLTTCRNCGSGWYRGNKGRYSSCIECPLGKYSGSGATSCLPKVVCGAGESAAGGAKAEGICDGCSAGYYQNLNSHSQACKPCGMSQYQDETRATSCKPKTKCSNGQFADGGTTAPGVCKTCPKGTYQDLAKHSFGQCKPCSPGRYTDMTGTGYCQPKPSCTQGKYLTGGTTAKGECATCPSGQFMKSNNHKSATCDICPAGTYMLPDRTGCANCADGYFQNYQKSSSCRPCTAGYYQDGTDRTGCKKSVVYCRAGQRYKYNGVIAESECIKCLPGFYSPNVGAHRNTECAPCQPGYYTDEDDQAQCLLQQPCPRGTYYALVESTVLNEERKCLPCTFGQFQDDHNHKNESCEDHSQCNLDVQYELESASETKDVVCANLTICERGWYVKVNSTQTSDRECGKCFQGLTEEGDEHVDCPLGQCAPGERSLNEEGTLCEPCPIGEYQTLTDHFEQNCHSHECAAATYLANWDDATNETICLPCPPNTFQPARVHSATKCDDQTLCGLGQYLVNSSNTSAGYCAPCNASKYEYMPETAHRNHLCLIGACGKNERLVYIPTTSAECIPCNQLSFIDESYHHRTVCDQISACPPNTYYAGDIEGTDKANCRLCGPDEYQHARNHKIAECNSTLDCLKLRDHYFVPASSAFPTGQCLPHPTCGLGMLLQVDDLLAPVPGKCVVDKSYTGTTPRFTTHAPHTTTVSHDNKQPGSSTETNIQTTTSSITTTTATSTNMKTSITTLTTTKFSDSDSSTSSSESSIMSVPMIAGIAGGALVLLLIIIVVIRRRRSGADMKTPTAITMNQAYSDPTPNNNDDDVDYDNHNAYEPQYESTAMYEEPVDGNDLPTDGYATLNGKMQTYGRPNRGQQSRGPPRPTSDQYEPMDSPSHAYVRPLSTMSRPLSTMSDGMYEPIATTVPGNIGSDGYYEAIANPQGDYIYSESIPHNDSDEAPQYRNLPTNNGKGHYQNLPQGVRRNTQFAKPGRVDKNDTDV